MQTLPSPSLVARPFRSVRDLWMAVALFVAVKATPGGVDKQTTLGFGLFACLLAAVWALGKIHVIRQLFETLLGASLPENISVDSKAIGPRIFAADRDFKPSESQKLKSLPWMFTGALSVIGALVFLEWRQPYYFVQDDNLSQFLPVVLHGCRSLLHDGVFPSWNPHQFLGSPTTTLGTYALTYPFTYLSYAIADGVLGNEYATMDVFCILHLLAGYFATYWACRIIGIRPSLSATTAVCFAISGFFLIAGRSWYYMTPLAVWMPLLVGLLEKYRRGDVGAKWILATGGALGLLFHAGNAQMWSYAIVFYILAVGIYLVCRAVNWSQLFPAAAALLVCGAIAAPLLLAQYAEIAGLPRRAGDGCMLRLISTIFLPYPFAKADFPGVPETPAFDHIGEMNYAGTVFSLVAMLGMLSLIAYRWDRRTTVTNIWLILAWVALLFTFGRTGALWYLLARIPPFSSFKHPFKFVAFTTLFMVIGGAMLMERGMRRWGAARRCEIGICGLALLFMAYHVGMSTVSFCDYGFRPYPDLPMEVRRTLESDQPQRMYAIGPRRSLSPQYAASMMHQLPTVAGCYALEGYDPLVSASPRFSTILDRLFEPAAANGLHMELGFNEIDLDNDDADKGRKAEDALKRSDVDDHGFWGNSFRVNLPKSLQTLRAYGVRWIVIYNGPQNPQIPEGSDTELFWKTDPIVEQLAEEIKEHCILAVNRPEIRIYELPKTSPLAFAADSPRKPLPVKMNAGGLEVDTSMLASGGQVVANVVQTRFLQATADGVSIPMSTDKWGRLLLDVPPGTRKLSACYQPPWLLGSGLGCLLAIGAYFIMRYRHRMQEVIERRFLKHNDTAGSLIIEHRQAA